MRSYPLWNFPAFDEATKNLRSIGWTIISPAELDRAIGFDEHLGILPEGFIEGAMRRDIEALLDVEAIILLPGWEKSSGVAIELTVARALGLKTYLYVVNPNGMWEVAELPEPGPESALEEAQRLVHGDRGEDYGHPGDDFRRTGRLWAPILEGLDLSEPIPPERVGLCMVAVKISREVNKPKRDNRVDGAGYFETVEMIHTRAS